MPIPRLQNLTQIIPSFRAPTRLQRFSSRLQTRSISQYLSRSTSVLSPMSTTPSHIIKAITNLTTVICHGADAQHEDSLLGQASLRRLQARAQKRQGCSLFATRIRSTSNGRGNELRDTERRLLHCQSAHQQAFIYLSATTRMTHEMDLQGQSDAGRE